MDSIYAENWKALIAYWLEENHARMSFIKKADEECFLSWTGEEIRMQWTKQWQSHL